MSIDNVNTIYLAYLMVKKHYKTEQEMILDFEQVKKLTIKYLKVIKNWIERNPKRTEKILNGELSRTYKYYYINKRKKSIKFTLNTSSHNSIEVPPGYIEYQRANECLEETPEFLTTM